VTRDELAQALAAASVGDREFDLNGSTSGDDAWVLERGKRYDEQHFLSEHEACQFMLNRLTSQG
jgi:cytochrome b involved in lipid metabolism